ncbi:MAG: B12-binding domain-containing radical SAM protein [Bdellovibrionota bacterium]
MKIALLTSQQPELVKIWVCQETSPAGSLLPPVDLASLAAAGRQAGLAMHLLDLRLKPQGFLATWLENEKPDAVILNLTTVSAPYDYKLLGSISGAIKKFAFGTHAQSNVEEAFAKGLDGIFLGDPEAVLHALAANGFDLESCPGVLTPANKDKSPHYAVSLDDLPFPALEDLNLDSYSAPFVKRGNRFSILMSSRGCPFQCTYCLYPVLFGAKARSRSPKNVVDEMEYDFKRFGIREFYFLDATFNLKTERITAICEEIISRGLDISWTCNMRVAPLDETLLNLMKRSGCRWIFFGVEDQDLLRETKKGTSISATQNAFDLARKAKIKTMAFTMVFPRDDIEEDAYVDRISGVLESLGADAFQCNIAIPFPGTAIFDEFRVRFPELKMDWNLYDPHGSSLPYPSRLNLERIKQRVYRRFFFQHPLKVASVAMQMNPSALYRQATTFIAKNLISRR